MSPNFCFRFFIHLWIYLGLVYFDPNAEQRVVYMIVQTKVHETADRYNYTPLIADSLTLFRGDELQGELFRFALHIIL